MFALSSPITRAQSALGSVLRDAPFFQEGPHKAGCQLSRVPSSKNSQLTRRCVWSWVITPILAQLGSSVGGRIRSTNHQVWVPTTKHPPSLKFEP